MWLPFVRESVAFLNGNAVLLTGEKEPSEGFVIVVFVVVVVVAVPLLSANAGLIPLLELLLLFKSSLADTNDGVIGTLLLLLSLLMLRLVQLLLLRFSIRSSSTSECSGLTSLLLIPFKFNDKFLVFLNGRLLLKLFNDLRVSNLEGWIPRLPLLVVVFLVVSLTFWCAGSSDIYGKLEPGFVVLSLILSSRTFMEILLLVFKVLGYVLSLLLLLVQADLSLGLFLVFLH